MVFCEDTEHGSKVMPDIIDEQHLKSCRWDIWSNRELWKSVIQSSRLPRRSL